MNKICIDSCIHFFIAFISPEFADSIVCKTYINNENTSKRICGVKVIFYFNSCPRVGLTRTGDPPYVEPCAGDHSLCKENDIYIYNKR